MSISQTQIEKMKLVHKTIKALAKIQDNFFEELVQELNLQRIIMQQLIGYLIIAITKRVQIQLNILLNVSTKL